MKTFLVSLLVCLSCTLVAQTNRDVAQEKLREAIQLMDNGSIQESIELLEECIHLDPGDITYRYEMAYAWYLDNQYDTVIAILSELAEHPDAGDLIFQLLGNSYDYTSDPGQAIATYKRGLERFPHSGRLHLELGNMAWLAGNYSEAISWYEKGMRAEPSYSSNYYRAALFFLQTHDEVWGMIYGEIFMNLERNSARTEEMSQLLYATYKSEITITDKGDSAQDYSISFSQSIVTTDAKKPMLPFGLVAYEPSLVMAVVGHRWIDIHSLNEIRTRFIDNYFANRFNKKYPNVLFDYQRAIQEAGHLECYNYWILSKGDEVAFETWYLENQEKWEAFVAWFIDNPIEITEKNVFVRTNY